MPLFIEEFHKNNVYPLFEDPAVPDETIKALISYFADDTSGLPQISIFDAAEKSHLKDVKQVLTGIRACLMICLSLFVIDLLLGYSLLGKGARQWLSRILFWGGVWTLLACLLLILLGLNFEPLFILFHQVFFSQGNWQFAASSSLIRLFPEQTFIDLFRIILMRTSVAGSLLTALGLLLVKRFPLPEKGDIKRYKGATNQCN
jgi:integral membrane protein (TIGR01906 family)